MGRGDKKTEKGKRFKGSFGNARPSKVEKKVAPKAAKTEDKPKKAVAKKAPAKKKATEE
ncbi:MAG: 30S ribosomal protein THX [Chitinophagales bacterium]|jgi:30S ribosomal protein S31|nr:30S ribosomal protein THX [Chitinophagales bacterium]